jgi:hypothetical protein
MKFVSSFTSDLATTSETSGLLQLRYSDLIRQIESTRREGEPILLDTL